MPYRIMRCSSCDAGERLGPYGHESANGTMVWACTNGLRLRESLAEILERHKMPQGLLEDLSAWQEEEREAIRKSLIEDLVEHVQGWGEEP